MRHVLALLTVLATGYTLPARADTGYSYILHEMSVDKRIFENVPLDHDRATVSYVEQGPEFTSRRGVYGNAIDANSSKAAYARGGDDRSIEGHDARHYTVNAGNIYREAEIPNAMRHLLVSDIRALPSPPYPERPFSVARACFLSPGPARTPRLAAALAETCTKAFPELATE